MAQSDGQVIIETSVKTEQAEKDIKDLNKTVKEQVKEIRDEFDKLEKNYKDVGESSEEARKKTDKLNDELDDTRKAGDNASKGLKNADEMAQKLAATALKAATAITAVAVGVSGAVIKMGVDFESAFAGVEKTVDAPAEVLEGFKQDILELSKNIPIMATEIAGIAEAAGQLGIKNESLMGFTKTMADLGVATNMTADEAATSLARFANITGMSQNDFDRLGSTIVDLGNNLATTESEIVAMSMRLAGSAKQAGMTEDEILAITAALSSVGVEAEAGGSAYSTALSRMQLAVETGSDSLKDYAKVAGMTADEFSKAFGEDAAGAFLAFLEGLNKANQEGESAIKILDEMGINEIRMRDALLRSSSVVGIFSDSLDIASEAWQANSALAEEAAKRYDTTESKMQMLQNTMTAVGIAAYEKFKEPFRDALAGATASLDELQDSVENGRLGEALDDAAEGMADLVEGGIDLATKALPVVIDGFNFILKNGKQITILLGGMLASAKVSKMAMSWKDVSARVNGYSDNIRKSAKSMTAYEVVVGVVTKKVTIATAAQAAWNAVLSPAGIMLAVTALGALTVGIIDHAQKQSIATNAVKDSSKALEEHKERMEELTETAKDQFTQNMMQISGTEKYIEELQGLIDAEGNVVGSKERVLDLIKLINNAYPELQLQYDEESGKLLNQDGIVKDLTESTRKLIEMKKLETYINANQERYTEALREYNAAQERNLELRKLIKDAEPITQALTDMGTAYWSGQMSGEEYQNQIKALAEDYGLTTTAVYDLAEAYPALIKEYEANEEAMIGNKKIIDEMNLANEALATSNEELANQVMDGLFVEMFDAEKGAEQIDTMKTKLDELKDQYRTLSEMNDESGGLYEDKLASLAEAIKAQEEQIAEAENALGMISGEAYQSGYEEGKAMVAEEMATDPEANAEAAALQGEADGTAYGEADKTAKVAKATEAAEESKNVATQKAIEAKSQIESTINSMSFPPKYVEIHAKYIGFDMAGGAPSGGGAAGASMAPMAYGLETAQLMAEIPPELLNKPATEPIYDMNQTTLRVAENAVSQGTILGGAGRALLAIAPQGAKGSEPKEVNIEMNYYQPIESPSQISRNLEKTARDLAKEGGF